MPENGESAMDELAAVVLRVIDRHDPEGLLSAGAPPDEYTPEARDIAGQIAQGKSVTENLVSEVWEHWFGNGPPVSERRREKYQRLAEDLRATLAGGSP